MDDQRRPLGGDDLRGRGDRAVRIVCVVHRPFHTGQSTPRRAPQLSKGKELPVQAIGARRATRARRRAPAALVDRPHDQRLAAACVACGEHAGERCRERRRATLLRASRSTPRPRAALAPGRGSPSRAARARPAASPPSQGTSSNGGAPLFCTQWMRSTRPSPESRVVETAKSRSPPSFERVRGAQLHRPERPRRQVVRALRGRLAEQLDLRHRGGALAVRVRDAVGAGVAAADHDHVLAGGGERGRSAEPASHGCARTR